jgi:endonuclease/exonuclease/phosphatase family metal-dependent hydrolase
MKVASINLRINVVIDGLNAWPHRKDRMISFIKEQAFDVIGCQEASPDMVKDLMSGLSDLYDVVFVPRDERGEGVPVFYKKEQNILETKTYWLSDEEDKVSMVDGSHFPRIVTFVRFDDLLFFNTHLDYVSDHVCLKQAKHLVRIIHKIRKDEDVIITGDFNTHPKSKTISYMLQHFKSNHHEKLATFHGFTDQKEGEPIDYIFYLTDKKTSSVMLHDLPKCVSDHYPISMHIE